MRFRYLLPALLLLVVLVAQIAKGFSNHDKPVDLVASGISLTLDIPSPWSYILYTLTFPTLLIYIYFIDPLLSILKVNSINLLVAEILLLSFTAAMYFCTGLLIDTITSKIKSVLRK